MKTIFLLLASIILVESYDTHDDDFHYADKDIEVLKSHMDCYLERAPCDEVSKSYLQFMKHGVETECSDCSEENKYAGWTFFHAAEQYMPEDYEKFIQKYDPGRRHWDKLMEVITPQH